MSGIVGNGFMGKKKGGGIVADGLILHLDADNPSSYSGSGTTWFDLTTNNNHFTLNNSPTFNTGGVGGRFQFNGTNQWAQKSGALTTSPNPFTAQIILNKPSTAGFRGLIEWSPVANRRAGVSLDGNQAINVHYGAFERYLNAIPLSQWMMLTGKIDGTTVSDADAWYNLTEQVLTSGGGSAANATALNVTRIGQFTTGSLFYSGEIAVVLVYDRIITQLELEQNYNFYQSKYSLP